MKMKFAYKCRLCGEIDHEPTTGIAMDADDATEYLLNAKQGQGDFNRTRGVSRESLHTCTAGGIGISDLCGAVTV